MVRSSTSRLADETGSSLVEVSVAMIILFLAVVPLVGMLETGLHTATSSGEYDAARALANERLEGVLALPYSRPAAADSAVERHAPPGPPDATESDLNVSVRTALVDGDLSGPTDSPPSPADARGGARGLGRRLFLDRRGRIVGAAVRRRLGREDGFTLPDALAAIGHDGCRAARALHRLGRERQGLSGRHGARPRRPLPPRPGEDGA